MSKIEDCITSNIYSNTICNVLYGKFVLRFVWWVSSVSLEYALLYISYATYLPSADCRLASSVLEPCGPLGVAADLSVFPGGVVNVVVGDPLLPTVVELSLLVSVVHCKHIV